VTEKKSRKQRRAEMMKEYGWTFVGISFAIFVLEMTILVILLELLQVSPAGIAESLGVEVDIPESSGTLVIAYILTRPLKIVQLPLAAFLTPVVARWTRSWQAARRAASLPKTHRVDAIAVQESSGETQD
jgi:hypothetical protein